MKFSTYVKIAALAAAGTCSWLISASILAQNGGAPPRNQSGSFGKRTLIKPGDAVAAPLAHAITGAAVASANMDRMVVEANGRSVAVSGRATVFDSRPDYRYMWTLSFRDQDDKEVFGRNYDKQVFTQPSGPISFNELITVKPGDYVVELALWHARPNIDLARFRKLSDSDLQKSEGDGDLELSAFRPIQVK